MPDPLPLDVPPPLPPVAKEKKPFFSVAGCGCLAVLVVGLLAVALPGYRSTGLKKRANQSEARTYLKALYTAQKAYFGEKDAYSGDARAIGFVPERGNRYTYFLAPQGRVLRHAEPELANAWLEPGAIIGTDRFKWPDLVAPDGLEPPPCPITPMKLAGGTTAGVGVTGKIPTQEWMGFAAVNLDGDPLLDCWSIATVDRVSATGERLPAGHPHNESNDVED